MIIVLTVSMVINNVIDNIIRTKIMADSLKVHPVLVLIGALVGVQLFGFIGIVVAAPVMASIALFLNYIVKKLSDQNPWKDLEITQTPRKAKWVSFVEKIWGKIKDWVKKVWQKIFKKSENSGQDSRKNDQPDTDEK